MPVPIIAAGIGGVSSILGSVFSGKPKTSTSTNTSSSASQGASSDQSTSSITPTFSEPMQQLIAQLLQYSGDSINNPTGALAPIRNAGLDSINRTYADIPNQVASQAARRGYGSSGALGSSLYKVGLARAGAASDLEGQLATQGIQQSQFGAGLGEQLLNLTKGTSAST